MYINSAQIPSQIPSLKVPVRRAGARASHSLRDQRLTPSRLSFRLSSFTLPEPAYLATCALISRILSSAFRSRSAVPSASMSS